MRADVVGALGAVVVAGGLLPAAPAALVAPGAFMNGMTDAGYAPTVFQTAVSDASVRDLRRTGTRWLAIQTAWYQTTDTSMDIAPWHKKTPTDASILHLMRLARHLGMRVFLNPFVNAKTGNAWQAAFHPTDWNRWFAAYDRCIVHYARLAQQGGADLFAIGDENDTSDMVPALAGQYRDLVRQVRRVYRGPVTYGADWPDYRRVTFWPSLDDIGVDAYFPLAQGSGDPPLAALEAAWRTQAANIAAWRRQNGLDQPVVITELGYPSEEGAAQNPGTFVPGQPVDLTIQSRLYQATFDTVYREPWLRGIFWFWWLNPSDLGWPGGPRDNGYGLQGKPVLDVLRRNLERPRRVLATLGQPRARRLAVGRHEPGT